MYSLFYKLFSSSSNVIIETNNYSMLLFNKVYKWYSHWSISFVFSCDDEWYCGCVTFMFCSFWTDVLEET